METYLTSTKKQFSYYRSLGERTMAQLKDEDLFWCYNEESNSIATIVKHLAGNMLSRWTDFLNTDGEKSWRNRDAEFENDIDSRLELMTMWNQGWDCLFKALDTITNDDWQKVIYIRSEPHTVVDAINRQLAHYPYHIGQIVFIGKMASGEAWNSLTIPKGKSETFNTKMFAKQSDDKA